METAAAVMARQSRNFRTPEEYARAYAEYRADIEPLLQVAIRIRMFALPSIRMVEHPDGRLEVMGDPDEGLPETLRTVLSAVHTEIQRVAERRGLMLDPGGAS